MISAKEYVIIYGGTFDPPHNGHLLCVTAVLRDFPKSTIFICPTYTSLKDATTVEKNTMFDFADRLEMLRLTFRPMIEEYPVLLSSVEEEMPRPNLTVNLITRLASIQQFRRHALLIGQDQFEMFPDWQQIDKIAEVADLIVIRRSGTAGFGEPLDRLRDKFQQRFIEHYQTNELRNKIFSIFFPNTPLLEISSSEVRQRYQERQSIDHLVPADVVNYLNNKR